MNPADKFMTPRQPPPIPSPQRLNTSPPVLVKKRPTRSVSPKSDKSQWSPRMFFGMRSQSSAQELDTRGRSSSSSKMAEGDSNISYSSSHSRSEDSSKVRSEPHIRDLSSRCLKRSHSREPSPRQPVVSETTSSYNSSILEIPDEIAEEFEDDDNFAIQLNRISLNERGILTALSPPPSGLRLRAQTTTDKPLPQLPEESPLPPISHLCFQTDLSAVELLPRSHFSASTVSTTIPSPTQSHFAFSETHSVSDSLGDDDLAADNSSGDEFMHSPVLPNIEGSGFDGYSLPDGEYASGQTVPKETPLSALSQTVASRTAFGGGAAYSNATSDARHMSALEELLDEMAYLGNVIVG